MRNILEYPVTLSEIKKCLNKLSEDINAEERIGDMRPLLLQFAAGLVDYAPDDVLAMISVKRA